MANSSSETVTPHDPLAWIRGDRARFYEIAKKTVSKNGYELVRAFISFAILLFMGAAFTPLFFLGIAGEFRMPMVELQLLSAFLFVFGLVAVRAFDRMQRQMSANNPAYSLCRQYVDKVEMLMADGVVHADAVGPILDQMVAEATGRFGIVLAAAEPPQSAPPRSMNVVVD